MRKDSKRDKRLHARLVRWICATYEHRDNPAMLEAYRSRMQEFLTPDLVSIRRFLRRKRRLDSGGQ